jgi:AcrR family transcriptional regulator
LLLTDGYAATTMARVARACDVSVESVYKRFGGKPGLVRAVVDRALAGEGRTPAEQRSDALSATDPEVLFRGWAQLTAEVAPRVAPILLLVRAAASHDRELFELAGELDQTRRRRMTDNAGRLAAAGQLRPGLTVEHAADVLWAYSSPELYDLLVLRSSWELPRYARFVEDGLRAHLLARWTADS